MKKKLTATAVLSVLATMVVAAPTEAERKAAAEKAAQVKKLSEKITAIDMGWGRFNSCFAFYYCPAQLGPNYKYESKEKVDALKQENLALQRERFSLDPSPAHEASLAAALAYLGKHDEAEPHFKAVVEKLREQKSTDGALVAKALNGYAECRFVAGDEEGAFALLRELRGRNINLGRWGGNPSGDAAGKVSFRDEKIEDYDQLPRFSGAVAYPDAQEATYEDAFTALTAIDVKTSGLANDDRRFGFFDLKLRRYGIEVRHVGLLGKLFTASAPYVLEVTVDPAAERFAKLSEAKRAEAYLFESGEKGGKILAATKQGALWGLVTFVQMIDREKKAIRRGVVFDYPTTAERGFLSVGLWAGIFEFSLMNKLNNVNVQGCSASSYNLSPLNMWELQENAKYFREYGLTLYYGMYALTMGPAMPLSSERTMEIQVDFCRKMAKMGAGVYYPYDDERYPMDPADKAKYGAAKNCDADHIDRLYKTVVKDYPDFKLIFCPPFYWGPDSNADGYGENREEYLASLKKIHPAVKLYWTGPMVKSFDKKPYQVKWFTDLTGHKPSIFQNAMGVHNWATNYGIDDFDFANWHYPEFWDEIGLFHTNGFMPCDACRNATAAQGMWNPGAYKPSRAAKRSAQNLFGEKLYDILLPGLRALEYFDKYKVRTFWGDLVHEDVKDLEQKVSLARECWKKGEEYLAAQKPRPRAGLGYYYDAPNWAAQVVAAAKNPPEAATKYKKELAEVEAYAKKEVGVDAAKGDLLLTPAMVSGGIFDVYSARARGVKRVGAEKDFDHPIEPRLVRILRGEGVKGENKMEFDFICDPFPPTGDYTLHICAMDDEREEGVKLRVIVNDQKVFEGDLGFPNHRGYAVKPVTLPFKALKRNSHVRIETASPGTNPRGTPWIMFNYMVLKKSAK